EKHLLRNSNERFWMLETIREYARERLHASDDETGTLERHTDHYGRLAESARPALTDETDRLDWLRRLQAELDNFRVALTSARDLSRERDEVRLVLALAPFWLLRGHWSEGRQWVSRALATDTLSTDERLAALSAAADFAFKQGDAAAENTYAEEELALARETENERQIARALNHLGTAEFSSGNYQSARQRFEESRAIARKVVAETAAAGPTINLGWLALRDNDLNRALSLFDEAVAICSTANPDMLVTAIGSRGVVLRREGRLSEAASTLAEALGLARQL